MSDLDVIHLLNKKTGVAYCSVGLMSYTLGYQSTRKVGYANCSECKAKFIRQAAAFDEIAKAIGAVKK